jgi:hypothetical protein
MKKAVWISYDLGVKGDYQGLYAWLDDHEAIECGNSVAFIRYEVSSEAELLENLKQDLQENVEFKAGDRIYVVRRETVDGVKKVRGKFIIGKRKSNPWEGYGSSIDDTIDE